MALVVHSVTNLRSTASALIFLQFIIPLFIHSYFSSFPPPFLVAFPVINTRALCLKT